MDREPIGRSNDDTCVVVPMFNEAQVIGEVVRELRRSFSHVVCVNDGSSDGSAAVAAAAGATVVSHATNLGAGAAFQTGVEFALRRFPDAQFVVTFDADGQHRVSDAVKMLCVARESGADVTLGSRFLEAPQRIPARRRLLLRAAVVFTRLTTGLPLTDTHCGLRVLNRRTAQVMKVRLPGMAHGSEILETIARSGLSYREVPVDVLYTEYSLRKGQRGINAVNILFDLVAARVWSTR
jgi:glycosyltransferase involved in cell wall biosynthesis